MNWYIIVAILGWTIWSFFAKLSAMHTHPMWLQTVNYIIGFCCIPIFLVMIKWEPYTGSFEMSGLLYAKISSVFGLIAYASYSYALRNGEVGTVAMLCSIYPTLVFILGVIFLGEPITAMKIGGIVMILSGTVLLAH